ncbi:MAG: right-handed parallel beta-helix repeat-containing protein [Candidatus Thermoplasmatota archaeon]|nr:right-handed parallel beta-helix repeat-containing protein [Candidatus Thermoplasmatota archaeon]
MTEILKALVTSVLVILFVFTSLCLDEENKDDGTETDKPVIKKGTLSSDEIWEGNIVIDETVLVPKGVVLTINAGTHISFDPYRGYKEPWMRTSLGVDGGTIKAIGDPDGMIWFTSGADDPINGDWEGIQIVGSNNSIFKYVIVEFAVLGIMQIDSSVEVSHSIIRWVNSEGLYAERSKPIYRSNMMYGNCYHDIALEQYNQDVMIEGNHFLGGHVSLHFEKTEAIVQNNLFTGYDLPITGGMDSTVTVRNNRFRNHSEPDPIGFDATVTSIIDGNDMGDDSVAPPEIDIVDIREKEIDYTPGDPEDLYKYVFSSEDETRCIVKKIGKGLNFGWSLVFAEGYLWRFSLGSGTIGTQLDFIRVDPETGDSVRFGNDVVMNPRGLTHDDEFFYVNDFSLLKIFKFRLNGTGIDILNSFDIPDKELGGTTGLTFDGEYLRLLSRGGSILHKITRDGVKVGGTTFPNGPDVGPLVWTGEYYWSASGGPRGLGKWDAEGNLIGSIFPAAEGTWAIAWDGEYIWTIQRTCEMWNDDKIYKIEVIDDSLPEDPPDG